MSLGSREEPGLAATNSQCDCDSAKGRVSPEPVRACRNAWALAPCAVMAPVAASLRSNRVVCFSLNLRMFTAQGFEHQFGRAARQDKALRYRGTTMQSARKRVVGPLSREVNKAMVVAVTVHDTRYGAKWQVRSIQRMGDEQRMTGRRLNGPEIVELHRQGIAIDERCAGKLLTEVKRNRCPG